MLGRTVGFLGEVTFAGVASATDHEIVARLRDANGRDYDYRIQVEPEALHRIRAISWGRALPPGMAIRKAQPGDGPALREVARGAPIQMADLTLAVDPGEDYWASTRLMGDRVYTYVATHEGKPVGVQAGASYPVRFDGREGHFFLIAHIRVLPEHSKGGVFSQLNSALMSHYFGSDVSHMSGIVYVSPGNAAAQRLGGAEARWAVRPFRAVLDCTREAGPPTGRAATAADAGRLVELLNHCHGSEELYLPYQETTLAERLSRSPDLYSWPNVLLGERAAVGVCDSGETRTFRRAEGDAWTQRRALALDYGFERGAEDELVALLHAWCARVLADAGVTHLGVFSSPASSGSDVLRSLAADVEEYDLMPPGLQEPATTATNGIYVDAVYF